MPVEGDTEVLVRTKTRLEELSVLYEKWHWEGITAESIVFAGEDVASRSDEELERLVRESPIIEQDSEVTIKGGDADYTFVNFNFRG